jgi:hypothetical protein
MQVKSVYRRNEYGTHRHCLPRAGRGSWSGSKYSATSRRPTPASTDGAVDTDALAVASRIAVMADREVRQRYHELVDKRLVSKLTVLERFELERIETRLDAEDRDPQIEARDRQWEMERTQLLESIQNLLLKLQK